ncbi:MAG: DUF2163 domain-containing protein [Pseudomonadota bacterium]
MSEAAFLAHLATGETTVARCWRLERGDGLVLGFTDHDRGLAFDGVDYEARAALNASEAAAGVGLGADDQDAAGAFSSAAITEADLAAGLWDGARVTVFDVNWRDVSARRTVAVYGLGEVERGEIAFRASLRSRAAALETRTGRYLLATCDAKLGDARCGVSLPANTTAASVVAVLSPVRIVVSGLEAYAAEWFDRGRVRYVTAGLARQGEIRSGGPVAGGYALTLWEAPPVAIVAGDALEVVAGCDRTADTCRTKFANGDRFRGFPHLPGEGFPLDYARSNDPSQDGGSRFAAG